MSWASAPAFLPVRFQRVPQVSLLRPGIVVASLLFSLTACRPHDFPQYDPNYREYAYVTNGGSGTVSVYDVVNVRVDREIPVGQNPTAVAANPARNEVYVVNSGTPDGQGSVAVINAENNSVAATIPVHKQPRRDRSRCSTAALPTWSTPAQTASRSST